MKLKFSINGKVVIVEAEGPLSVQVQDEPACEPASTQKLEAEPAVDGDLFSRLVDLRRQLASEQGVPPYVVFNDHTLRQMAEQCPADLSAFSQIPGVGKMKLEKYSDAFLEVIQGAV